MERCNAQRTIVVFPFRWFFAPWQTFSRRFIRQCWTPRMWHYCWGLQRSAVVKVDAPEDTVATLSVHPVSCLFSLFNDKTLVLRHLQDCGGRHLYYILCNLAFLLCKLYFCYKYWNVLFFLFFSFSIVNILIVCFFTADKLRRFKSEGSLLYLLDLIEESCQQCSPP